MPPGLICLVNATTSVRFRSPSARRCVAALRVSCRSVCVSEATRGGLARARRGSVDRERRDPRAARAPGRLMQADAGGELGADRSRRSTRSGRVLDLGPCPAVAPTAGLDAFYASSRSRCQALPGVGSLRPRRRLGREPCLPVWRRGGRWRQEEAPGGRGAQGYRAGRVESGGTRACGVTPVCRSDRPRAMPEHGSMPPARRGGAAPSRCQAPSRTRRVQRARISRARRSSARGSLAAPRAARRSPSARWRGRSSNANPGGARE
jgi:hypothetical protein